MADVNFGNTGVAPIATPTTPSSSGVINNSEAVGTTNLANTISTATKSFDQIFSSISTSNNNKLLSGFAQDQLKFADAVDQGLIKSPEALTKSRALTSSFLSENPGLTTEALKVVKNVINTRGLGAVISSGTQQEQDRVKLTTAASNAGFIPNNATEEQLFTGTESYRKSLVLAEIMKQNAADAAASQAKLNEAGKITSNEKATLELGILRIKKDSRERLVEYTSLQHGALSNQLNTIVSDYQSGKIGNINDATKAILTLENNVLGVTSQLKAQVGSDFGNALVAPIENTFSTYKKILSGELTATAGNNEITNLKNRYTLMALGDEKTSRLVAASNLFGNRVNRLLPDMSNSVLKFLNTGGKGIPTNPIPEKDDTTVKTAIDVLKENIGSGDKQTDKEVGTQIDSLLGGINAYKTFINEPKDLNTIMSFLASDKVGKFGAEKGGFSRDVVKGAEDVIAVQYKDVLLPLIKDEFTQSKVSVIPEKVGFSEKSLSPLRSFKPTPSQISVSFMGAGVRFETQSKQKDVVNKTEELNNTLAPTINQLLRVGAHLQGKVGGAEYKKQWEAIMPKIGLGEPQKPVQADQQPSHTTTPDTSKVAPTAAPKTDSLSISTEHQGEVFNQTDINKEISRAKKSVKNSDGPPALIKLINNEGGDVVVSYDDGKGNLTAGIGHKLTADEIKLYPLGTVIPQDVRSKWFDQDTKKAEKDVKSFISDNIPDKVKSILVNMSFNMGLGKKPVGNKDGSGLKSFIEMRKAILDKKYKLASQHMEWKDPKTKAKHTDWFNQVGDRAKVLISDMSKITTAQ